MAMAAALLVMVFSAHSSAAELFFNAQPRHDRWNWGYCAPPYPPACIDALAKAPKDRADCEKTVERYVASVFVYRGCLAAETERAVREANHVLQSMKCPKDPRYCYDLPQPNASSVGNSRRR